MNRDRPLHLTLLALLGAVLVWSWIGAEDRPTWWMEAFPIFVVLPVMWGTRRRFPLSRLLWVLIVVHAAILLVGAHYTYAKVPAGDWVKDWLHLSRNHYDRLGHLAQGFIPAIAAREVLLRNGVVTRRGWLFFLVMCICMAVSACYELVEWGAAVSLGQGADQFLATQGDPFDTQEDMACALVGASVALLTLSRLHDREIRRLGEEERA